MSNARMDRGPIGTAHSLSEEAERRRSPAAESGSEARADAGGSQVQCFVGRAHRLALYKRQSPGTPFST
jgi:hypothetical protein